MSTPATVKVTAPSTLEAGSTFEAVAGRKTFTVTVPEGGVEKGQEFEVPSPPDIKADPTKSTPATVTVTAPSTLEAGFTFEAVADGKTFTVTVPEGGVEKGQEFEVPYPSDAMGAPQGKFKHDLFSCCDIVSEGLFWMAFCCTPITEAQLLTRMRLDWCGKPATPTQVANTFGIVVGIFIAFLVFNFWVPFVGLAFVIYSVVYGIRLRKTFRTKYDVPASLFGDAGCWDDCCCMFWCGCCTTIQMARQTHDEEQYPYQCCTANGLSPDAPSIV